MNKWIWIASVGLGLGAVDQHYPLEKLVQAALTFYLVIAGFAVLLLQYHPSQFLRPLFPIAAALIVLPPLFYGFTQNLTALLHYWQFTIDRRWLSVLFAALIVFFLFRVVVWYRSRPPRPRPAVHRDRERVMPRFDVEDDLGG
jgi:hypothetical protein